LDRRFRAYSWVAAAASRRADRDGLGGRLHCRRRWRETGARSRQAIVGAAIGTVAGIFSGLWGLLFMPLVGVAIGEYLAQRDVLRAGKAGIETWIGLMLGTVAKIAIVLAMVGIFVFALLA